MTSPSELNTDDFDIELNDKDHSFTLTKVKEPA